MEGLNHLTTMKKICLICHSEFEPKYWQTKYCSKECAHEAKKRQMREYQRKKRSKFPCGGLFQYDIPIEMCLSCKLDECKYEIK